MPRESAANATLLSNAGATGAGVSWDGGKALLVVLAGTGGATTAVEVLGPDGATYVQVPNASFTANGALSVELPAGTYRAAVTGGTTPAGIYAQLRGVL